MSTLILHLPLALPGPHTEYRYTLSLDGHSASGHASAPAPLLPAANETVAPRERKQRRGRASLSMPYFSFAQSLRPRG